MKTVILYYSIHHGNTKKVAETISAKYQVPLVNIVEHPETDVSEYDLIGIASGIYAGHFGKPIEKYVKERLPEGKKVFLISTAAGPKPGYEKAMRKLLAQKPNVTLLDSFMCQGFNTFGPTKWFGGTGKGHPTQAELDAALAFYEGLQKR